MKVAILVLNYNGKALLSTYLGSVVRHKEEAEVWVVDNGSTDDSLDLVKKNFPEVKVLVLDNNFGYTKGYNLAVSKIDADLYCFLNNDVRVNSDWVTPMRQLFKTQQHLGFAQPKIVSDQNKSFFEYAGAAGGRLDLFGFPYCRGRYLYHCEKDQGQYDNLEKVTWASGAAFWVRKTAFTQLGGFDERFFMHFEEIDLCLRGKAVGWITMCNGNVHVAHLGGGTLPTNQPKKLYFNIRNSLWTYTKTIPAFPLLLIIFFRLGFDFFLGLFLFFTFKFDHVWAIVKAHNHFFRVFPKTLFNRKKTVMPLRITSVFVKFLVAKVNPK
jgi:GT2 family glycosyltransferase